MKSMHLPKVLALLTTFTSCLDHVCRISPNNISPTIEIARFSPSILNFYDISVNTVNTYFDINNSFRNRFIYFISDTLFSIKNSPISLQQRIYVSTITWLSQNPDFDSYSADIIYLAAKPIFLT